MSEELSATLWAGIPGTIALVLTKYLSGWARDMLLFLGVVLAIFAIVIFMFWCVQQRRLQAKPLCLATIEFRMYEKYLLFRRKDNLQIEDFLRPTVRLHKYWSALGWAYW